MYRKSKEIHLTTNKTKYVAKMYLHVHKLKEEVVSQNHTDFTNIQNKLECEQQLCSRMTLHQCTVEPH